MNRLSAKLMSLRYKTRKKIADCQKAAQIVHLRASQRARCISAGRCRIFYGQTSPNKKPWMWGGYVWCVWRVRWRVSGKCCLSILQAVKNLHCHVQKFRENAFWTQKQTRFLHLLIQRDKIMLHSYDSLSLFETHEPFTASL